MSQILKAQPKDIISILDAIFCVLNIYETNVSEEDMEKLIDIIKNFKEYNYDLGVNSYVSYLSDQQRGAY